MSLLYKPAGFNLRGLSNLLGRGRAALPRAIDIGGVLSPAAAAMFSSDVMGIQKPFEGMNRAADTVGGGVPLAVGLGQIGAGIQNYAGEHPPNRPIGRAISRAGYAAWLGPLLKHFMQQGQSG